MLSSDEIAQLAGAICATAETLGQTISAGAAQLMAEDLAEYSAGEIRKALQSCRRELTGKLTLAAVLNRIQAEDGRPGRDEAWAIALASSDEFDTVVMTDEIQLALNAARPVLDAGDKIGARMAFISAYDRFVTEARTNAQTVNWKISLGFDAGRRVAAIHKAAELQRIPRERAQLLIADMTHEPVTEDGRAIAGLLTGTVAKPSANVAQKIRELKQAMHLQNTKRKLVEAHRRRRERRDLNERVIKHMEAIEELQKQRAIA
jgi:hypothetical protein